jgi:hypothetical protein
MTEVEYRIDPKRQVAAAIDAAEETGDPLPTRCLKSPAAGRQE